MTAGAQARSPEGTHGRVADTPTAVRATRQTAVAQALTQGVRFATNIVLARLLVPEDFGIVALALVVSAAVDQVRDMGTGAILIQRPRVDHELLSSVFWLNLALGGVLAAVLVVSADPLAGVLGAADAGAVFRAMGAVTVVAAAGQVHHALLRRDLRFGALAVITSLAALLNAGVAVGLAVMGWGYWAMVAGIAAGTLAGTVLAWLAAGWRPGPVLRVASLRSIWRESAHLFVTNLAFLFYNQVDKVIIGRLVGIAPLGAYALAQRTVMAPVAAVGSVAGEVAFPSFSRRQDDDAALCRGFVRSSRAIGFLTLPAMCGLAALAGPAVRVVLGERWAAVVPLVWVLAPVAAVLSISSSSASLLLAKGRTDLTYRWGLVYCVVLTVLQVAGTRWGLVGVAAGFALGIAVLAPLGLLLAFGQVGLRLRDFARSMAPQVVVTLLMTAVVLAVSLGLARYGAGDGIRLIVGTLAGVASYGASMLALRPPVLLDVLLLLGRGGGER